MTCLWNSRAIYSFIEVKNEFDWQLVDWTIGWLDNWSTGQLVDWRIGRLENWMTGQLVDWTIGWLDNWSTGKLVEKMTDRVIGRLRDDASGFSASSQLHLRNSRSHFKMVSQVCNTVCESTKPVYLKELQPSTNSRFASS